MIGGAVKSFSASCFTSMLPFHAMIPLPKGYPRVTAEVLARETQVDFIEAV
jgi:hypothetical protein